MTARSSILGIEIGGTKLQFGVADASSPRLVYTERHTIVRDAGAEGILAQIERVAPTLMDRYQVGCIGVGFGGPVDGQGRRVITSHQVKGWDGFPLSEWCEQRLGCPAVVGNDCNVAALAEARQGAGRGLRRVFYVTVGTGIGGGLVIDGRIDGHQRPAVAEIGHLRPGLAADRPQSTVESRASGLAIEREASRWLTAPAGQLDANLTADLARRCQGDPTRLTTQLVAEAAREGNRLATELLEEVAQVLGWAIAQTITLVAPQRVVLGGGVSLIGEWLLQRVRESTQRYVFPPLAEACDIVPAQLGEEVVVCGAVELASDTRAGTLR